MARGSRRLYLLLGGLAISSLLVAYDRRPQASPVIAEATARAVRAPSSAGLVSAAGSASKAAPAALEILPLQDRSHYVTGPDDAFAGAALLRASAAVPAPAPVAVPVAPAAAPALPYTVIGKKFEADTWEVYLARGDATLVARLGAVLDEVYRVDAIAPPTMDLTYLPLDEKQSLAIGAPLHD